MLVGHLTSLMDLLVDISSVLQSLCEEDTARPHDYFKKADIEDTKDAHMKKFAKSIKKQIKKEGGISRAAYALFVYLLSTTARCVGSRRWK